MKPRQGYARGLVVLAVLLTGGCAAAGGHATAAGSRATAASGQATVAGGQVRRRVTSPEGC